MPKINPYNFVPLSENVNRTPINQARNLEQFVAGTYSGEFKVRILTVTPLIIPSRRNEDINQEKCKCSVNCEKQKTTFKLFSHQDDQPMIPATSIKGMVRSVFETISNSCLINYGQKDYILPNDYHVCTNDELCPACRIFGTVETEDSLAGRVRFSDALGIKKDLEFPRGAPVWILPELSSPKPERHVPFYARDGRSVVSVPRGRKFYFHHNPVEVTNIKHNHRNIAIGQRLKAGAWLDFKVSFNNLSEQELAWLVYAIELDLSRRQEDGETKYNSKLAHKLGMGKPIGFGSIRPLIKQAFLDNSAQRYQRWDDKPLCLENESLWIKLDCLKILVSKPSEEFLNIFSRQKHHADTIAYPGYDWFLRNGSQPLQSDGSYNP